jgi:hypothetical protein
MIEEAFPASLLGDIANSNWKTRLAGKFKNDKSLD